MSPSYRSSRKKLTSAESGQAAVELAIIVTLLSILICAAIDFGRALNYMQIIAELTRQGSMLASRGEPLNNAVQDVDNDSAGLDLSAASTKGEVIITEVTNQNGTYTITDQSSQGGLGASSKVGSGIGAVAKVPAAISGDLQVGQTIFVTEIFYTFQPFTPIGAMTNNAVSLPSTLYDSAYF